MVSFQFAGEPPGVALRLLTCVPSAGGIVSKIQLKHPSRIKQHNPDGKFSFAGEPPGVALRLLTCVPSAGGIVSKYNIHPLQKQTNQLNQRSAGDKVSFAGEPPAFPVKKKAYPD